MIVKSTIYRMWLAILAFICSYLLIGLYLHSIDHYSLQEWEGKMLFATVVLLAAEIFSFFFLFSKKNILVIFFIILTFLFHFSHLLLIFMDFSFGSTAANLPMIRFGERAAREAFEVNLKFQCANFFGFFLYDLSNNIFTLSNSNKKRIELRIHNPNMVAFSLFFIGFLVWGYRSIWTFINTAEKGYGNIEYGAYDSFLIIVSRIFLSGLILIMAWTKSSHTKKIVLYFGIIAYGLSMFSGERAYALISLCILLYTYYKGFDEKKIGLRQIILLVAGSYVLMIILNAIRLVRANGMSISLLQKSFSTASVNPFLSLINEFGISENVVAKVCKDCTTSNSGLQFLTSFVIVIPGISYIVPIDFGQLSLAVKLDAANLGGSFIADCYFDFQNAGFIFAFLYGIILCKFFYYFSETIELKDYFRTAYLAPILVELMFTIRSSTYKIPRFIVFYSIFFILVCSLETFVNSGIIVRKQRT